MWMKMAHAASERSTCYRGNVGALVVKGTDILSIGYNGAEAGEPHCTGHTCQLTPAGSCSKSIHAERNALMRCDPADSMGADLYTTASPCRLCATLIVDRWIARVIYGTFYRDVRPVDLLVNRGILVYRLTPSGYLIDHQTNELVNDTAQ